MIDFGTVEPGTTLYIPFNTFDSNDPSGSVTITGLATTDIEVYKDGSMTQRASDAGYTLLDTDGIDLDGTTGIHGISIDLSDNTTAGFYAAGSQYYVVIAGITVDAATINFIPANFRVGYEGASLNTTIATLASQTSFTLTSGPPDNDALNGHYCIIHDVASGVQRCTGIISDYVGSTQTVTLAADPGIFTIAATDNFSVMGLAPLQPTVFANTLDVTATGAAGIDWGNIENPTTAVDLSGTDIQLVDTCTTNTDMRGTDSAALASVCTEARLAELDAANLATDIANVKTDTTAILVDTNELQTDDIPGLIAALNDLSAAQVNAEVVDALNVDTYAEPGQGVPPATASLATKLGYLYKLLRNKKTQTATEWALYDDAGTTVDQKATVSDDGTTATKGEIASGP